MARCVDVVLVALARVVHSLQRQQHLAGIVHIRLMIVVEEEAPAARLDILDALC